MQGDPRNANSSFRFSDLKFESLQDISQEQDKAIQSRAEHDAARSEQFGENAHEALQDKYGEAREAPAEPMQKDQTLSEKELTPPHRDGQLGGQRNAGPDFYKFEGAQSPDVKLGDHAYAAKSERGDGDDKKLEFYEDQNPPGQDHDPTIEH